MAIHADHGREDGQSSFDVAIIGGGIVGLLVALGLAKRHVSVTVYEKARELKEIGAGLGFATSFVECIRKLDPCIAESLDRVAVKAEGCIRWVDNCKQDDARLRSSANLADMEWHGQAEGELLYSCHRAQLLDELVRLMAPGRIKLGKCLDTIVQLEESERCIIKFTDGTTAEADAVIGCDGIKSRVRQVVLAKDDPAAVPHYAHESVYRCLVDMEKAAPVYGQLVGHFILNIGPGAHIGTYPIADHKYLNVAAFVRDDKEWPAGDAHTAIAAKQDILEAFAHFSPHVKDLLEILPDELNRWGMFDTLDHPLSTYAFGRVALAGDAAHASTPHHGAGAGMGIEDALVLATLFEKAGATLGSGTAPVSKAKTIENVFQAYDSVRRGRSQWLVWSSRRQGAMVKWDIPEFKGDYESWLGDVRERTDKAIYYDRDDMVRRALDEFERRQQSA